VISDTVNIAEDSFYLTRGSDLISFRGSLKDYNIQKGDVIQVLIPFR